MLIEEDIMAKHLFARICDLKTLYQAWSRVKSGGTAAGADAVSLGEFERSLSANLAGLARDLSVQTYVPEPVRHVFVPKGSGEKRRLSVPTVRDRVAQQAVRIVIEPLFESRFAPSSFGYRPNRGPQAAVTAVERSLARGQSWVATADIDDFFDSMNHALLLRLVEQRIWEKPVLRLIELWVRMGAVSAHGWDESLEGIPQGGVISPLLSNVYLHSFDAEMQRLQHPLVRYADDFTLMAQDRAAAVQALADARTYLREQLLLHVDRDSVRHREEGFVFLGFLFKGCTRTIAPDRLTRMQARLEAQVRQADDLDGLVRDLNLILRGWRNYYGTGQVQEQFEFLEDRLFQALAARLKALTGADRPDCRLRLSGLESLSARGLERKGRFIELLLARSDAVHKRPAKAELPSVEQAVRQKRRKYELLLDQEANLVVSGFGSFLGKTSKRLVVKEKGRKVREVPFHRLKNVLIAGRGVTVSSDLVQFCAHEGVPVIYMNDIGQPYAYVFAARLPFHSLSVLQAEALKSQKGLELARAFVQGKVTNQVNLLKYYARYKERRESGFKAAIDAALTRMGSELERLDGLALDAFAVGRMFAIEGRSAAIYWGLVKELLANDVMFQGREKKGATDLVNSLLNYGYGVLYSQVYLALIIAGLNPNLGFLHRGQTDRPALLYDMVEEFRQPVVDRAVIGLIRKKVKLDMEGVVLADATRRKLIDALMRALGGEAYYRGQRVRLSKVIECQTARLAQCLRGECEYRPFVFH
jgi:group II intron reverse transcriptase/maturase/CRISPR-associated endonuclease Cas1